MTFIPFRESYRIRAYEADLANRVRISSLFNYMQDAASTHADVLGFGYRDLSAASYYWALSRAKIAMTEYPSTGEEITVVTWPRQFSRIFAMRDFRLLNQAGRTIGKATTSWLVMNRETMHPVNPGMIFENTPDFGEEPAFSEAPDKIKDLPGKVFHREILAGYSDIDMNRHVNNERYIEFILDCFPEEDFREKRIASMQVNFLSETKYGETIRIFSAPMPDCSHCRYIEGTGREGTKVFQSLTEWVSAT